MIEEADRDGDGEIGEDDFIRIMKKSNLFWYIIFTFYNNIFLLSKNNTIKRIHNLILIYKL